MSSQLDRKIYVQSTGGRFGPGKLHKSNWFLSPRAYEKYIGSANNLPATLCGLKYINGEFLSTRQLTLLEDAPMLLCAHCFPSGDFPE